MKSTFIRLLGMLPMLLDPLDIFRYLAVLIRKSFASKEVCFWRFKQLGVFLLVAFTTLSIYKQLIVIYWNFLWFIYTSKVLMWYCKTSFSINSTILVNVSAVLINMNFRRYTTFPFHLTRLILSSSYPHRLYATGRIYKNCKSVSMSITLFITIWYWKWEKLLRLTSSVRTYLEFFG